jgi:hypothetical protein
MITTIIDPSGSDATGNGVGPVCRFSAAIVSACVKTKRILVERIKGLTIHPILESAPAGNACPPTSTAIATFPG